MNIDFTTDKFRFNARTSAVIYNKEEDKILLFNVEGRKVYLLPGGRIEGLEKSYNAIAREIKEELGWDLDYSFLALSEEFIPGSHQLNIVYKAIYEKDIIENRFKGLEGDWINFEWVDIKELEKYNLFPSGIKNVILKKDLTNHIIEDLREKGE